MASIQYRLIEKFFKLLGVNKMLDKEGEDFDKLLLTYQEKQKKPLKVPYKKLEEDFIVQEDTVNNVKYYRVKEKNKVPDKAILYLFGGGYILPPDSGDLILCGQMAKACHSEVWFPLYPMAPKNRLVETLEGTKDVYLKMLEEYTSEQIRFFGTSSGGGQCLSLCMYLRHYFKDIPLPHKLVLQSPGLQVPPSAKQKAKMEELKKYDVMIPPRFFDNIAPVLAKGEEAFLLSPILDDLTGYPEMDIFYGTHECMYAYLDDMVETCNRCGVKLNVHVGEGMMHCWGAMEFVPEAKAVRKEYFKALM